MRKLNCMENFKRDISYQVGVQEDESIILTGTLRDRLHDIEVKIVADGGSLKITDAHVTFRAAPSPYCAQVEKQFLQLVGVTIGKGLSRSLNEVLGGSTGCGNLRTMLMGLLPLALNVKACAGVSDEQEMHDTMSDKLQGTCVGYPVLDKGR